MSSFMYQLTIVGRQNRKKRRERERERERERKRENEMVSRKE